MLTNVNLVANTYQMLDHMRAHPRPRSDPLEPAADVPFLRADGGDACAAARGREGRPLSEPAALPPGRRSWSSAARRRSCWRPTRSSPATSAPRSRASSRACATSSPAPSASRTQTRELWDRERHGHPGRLRRHRMLARARLQPAAATIAPAPSGRSCRASSARLEPGRRALPRAGGCSCAAPTSWRATCNADQPGVVIPPKDGWHDTGDIVTIDDGATSPSAGAPSASPSSAARWSRSRPSRA